ncbi:MAG: cytochrome c oxidase subunit 3, partial [Bacteroidota bacterium]
FASLLASYFYIRFNSVMWPPQGIQPPALTLPAINTLIVLVSSVVMQWALGSIRRGEVGRLRAGLAAAFVLYAAFLAIQFLQYAQAGFPPRGEAYGSLFWAITGLHALHVLAGLLMNAFVQVRAGYRHFGTDRYQAVENIVLYWHFVDIVWLLIFVCLYLSPYL